MRLVRRLPRLLLVFAALTWAWVGMMITVHHASVTHVVCPEDGQTVEVHHGARAHPVDTIAAASSQTSPHDECGLPPGSPGSEPLSGLALSFAQFAAVPYDALGELDARVAGPLQYAPKTSPPSLG